MYQRSVGIFNLIFDEEMVFETLKVWVSILSCSGVLINWFASESGGVFANRFAASSTRISVPGMYNGFPRDSVCE